VLWQYELFVSARDSLKWFSLEAQILLSFEEVFNLELRFVLSALLSTCMVEEPLSDVYSSIKFTSSSPPNATCFVPSVGSDE
jgi:hypothetical protein